MRELPLIFENCKSVKCLFNPKGKWISKYMVQGKGETGADFVPKPI